MARSSALRFVALRGNDEASRFVIPGEQRETRNPGRQLLPPC